jgi:hypothetical protein
VKHLTALALLLLASTFAYAREGGPFNLTPSGWDTETRIWHDAYQVAHAVDCAQTYYIASHPKQYKEGLNTWVLGEHPDTTSVAVWCVTQAYAYSVITQALVDGDASPAVRRVWYLFAIGVTLKVVESNYNIGIKWGF